MKNKKHYLNCGLFFLFLALSLNVQAASYKSILKKITRKDQVYQKQDLKANIIWNVSPLTDELIAAQTNRYAKAYDPQPAEKAKFQSDLLAKRGGESLFFVSFYSGDRKYGDLSNPKAKWELRFESQGEALAPSRIEKINSPNPVELMLYPYLTPWSRGYYVWFPIDSSRLTSPFLVSLHGATASSTLDWK